MRTIVAVIALVASSITVAVAQPAPRCTHEAFPVAGQSVSITVCAGAPDGGKSVQVVETFKGKAGAFSHTASIDVLRGAATSRTADDVNLAPLALPYTLHLTLAYHEASVTIEHAMLLPGAVPLK